MTIFALSPGRSWSSGCWPIIQCLLAPASSGPCITWSLSKQLARFVLGCTADSQFLFNRIWKASLPDSPIITSAVKAVAASSYSISLNFVKLLQEPT